VSLDFPRAWEIARAAPAGAHHPRCSYAQTGGALLCELGCPVLAGHPETGCAAMHGAGGIVVRAEPPDYGPCPGHGGGGGESETGISVNA